jgi:toxin-antitoxin system PIN domain toxin
VILIDSNILIYAYNEPSPQHARARDWLVQQFNGTAQVGLPWQCILSFVRITTNPRAFPNPLSIEDAWSHVSTWLRREIVWTPNPTERHKTILAELLMQAPVRGNFVMDAHLAALAIENGLTLCSADSDFAKFPGLRWINPLLPDKAG